MSAQRFSKLGEFAVIAVLVVGTGYLGNLVRQNRVSRANAPSQPVRFAPRMIPATGDAGAPAPVILEGRERPLLLLVMRTTCPYCEENMPGWVDMVAQLEQLGPDRPDVMVLSVSPLDETLAYLQGHGLDVPARQVDGSALPLLGLGGFPSTVAVDPTTRGLAVWEGVLTDSDREAIRAWALPAGMSLAAAGGR